MSKPTSTAENYLRDVIPMVLERAREATEKARRQGAADAAGEFIAGRREAYYEVVSTLLGQLDAFGIPRSSVGVPDEFDPERALL